jgi:hypothetical protein
MFGREAAARKDAAASLEWLTARRLATPAEGDPADQ